MGMMPMGFLGINDSILPNFLLDSYGSAGVMPAGIIPDFLSFKLIVNLSPVHTITMTTT